MPTKIRPTFWYDVTREMRQLVLKGKLTAAFPTRASGFERALLEGGRIVYSPDEDDYYQEIEMDQLFQDPQTGRTCGVRKI
ncbi:MAG: hypothetical protein ACKVX7_00790 [Planctomycetota bacterium]